MRPTKFIPLLVLSFTTVAVTAARQSAPVGSPRPAGQRALQTAPAPDAHDAVAARTLIDRYCIGCHNERLKTANLVLENMDVTHVAAGAETWEKVLRKVKTGAMPPVNAARPDRTAADAFVAWLEQS